MVEFDTEIHAETGSNRPIEYDLAAGPAAVFSVDDKSATVADKSPGLLEGQVWDDFFSATTVTGTSDPTAVYDTYGDRYLMVVEEVEQGTLNLDGTGGMVRGGYTADEARLLIGVSTHSLMNDLDKDPGDTEPDWHRLEFDATLDFGGTPAFLDAPRITVDASYLYVVGEYYEFGTRAFQGSVITRLSKSQLFAGSLSSSWTVTVPGGVSGLVPVESTGRSGSDPVLFADADTAGAGIRLWEVNSSFTLTDAGTVNSPFAAHAGGVPQSGSVELLDSASPGLTNAVWRDDSLWTAHTVDDSGEASVRWYEIDTTGGAYSLAQTGDIDPGVSIHAIAPAISVDAAGNMGIVYTQSSATQYPAMMISGRLAADAAGTTATGIAVQTQTEPLLASPDDLGFWGRSTDIALDPWDDSTFWAVQRFHAGDSGWGHVVAFAALEADRFEANETRATAADAGVGPGVHLGNLSIHDTTDQDWYQFELLRPDNIDVDVKFQTSTGVLAFDVTDHLGTVLQSSTPSADGASCSLAGLAAGTYYVHVSGSPGATNVYSLEITPTSGTSSTRLFYVNDSSSAGDSYTYAPGDDTNDGLTAHTPKASVQSVLSDYDLGPMDLVLVDTGSYGGSTITIDTADEGAAYAGAPGGSLFNYSGTRWDLVDADHNLIYAMGFSGSGGTGIHLGPGASDPSTDNVIRRNSFTGTATAISIDEGTNNLLVDNLVSGSGNYGVYAQHGASFTWQEGSISGRTRGIYSSGSTAITVQDADIQATNYGIYVHSGSLTATDNTIHGASYGVYQHYYGPYTNSLTLTGNEIHDNDIGVYSRIAATSAYGNEVHHNVTGIESYGVWGASDWTLPPNDIHDNTTGLRLRNGGEVRFNRIHGNTTGIDAQNQTDVHHNVLYRNTGQAVLVDGHYDVAIENNTVYAPLGHGVRLRGGAYDVALKNNIIWTESGYGVYVDTDSQQGFESDYNNLFSTGGGQPVWWQKAFADLFDWQVEAGLDEHSIGYTVSDPALDNPQFVNLAGNDYGLSPGSTSIDAGDPSSLFANEPSPDGGRINLGAYGDTVDASASPTQYLQIDYPNYYTDWQNTEEDQVLWHTYDSTEGTLSGNVDIDLVDAASLAKVADIAVVPAIDGAYGWSPQDNGINPDTMLRYRIQITALSHGGIVDASREGFSVPETSNTFYVNDDATANDEYSAAVGNNRNTGKTAGDPKANLLPILRSYDLGPGDTVQIDTGDYIHVRNVTISGATGVGDDEGAIFTGPMDPSRIAHIDRANPYSGSTNIEINDGDYVTLRNLTLTGAQKGLWVRNDSTFFTGVRLIVSDNSSDGITVESSSSDAVVDELQAFNNGGTGIHITTPIDTLSNSVAYNNVDYGIHLYQTGATLLENNVVHDNNTGIYVYNLLGGSPTVIGSSDLSGNDSPITAKGNTVYDNHHIGIQAYYNVLVAGNTVYGHDGSGDRGIYLYSSGTKAEQNIVWGNTTGIYADHGGCVENNRVYNNSNAGIYLYRYESSALGNVVYSNSIGIQAQYIDYRGRIENNLVYANSAHGVQLNQVSDPQIANNTVYQEVGDAVHIQDSSSNVNLRNNILWVEAGYDIYVDPSSQTGFASDYNDLFTSGTGQVAYWQAVPRPTLQAWQNTAFTDQNSLSQDPLFVDVDGADNQLGYDAVAGIDHGVDDDFHVQSAATDGPAPGSFHGGSLAPMLHGATGLPVDKSGSWIVDAASSPVIDRGDAADSYANEPVPNGSYINLGTYGNTDQASTSPAEYVLVTRPDGGEVWPADQTFPVRWRTEPTVLPGSAADYSAEVLSDPVVPAPVGYWRLGDTAPTTTAVDATGNGHDGTYTNDPALNQTGIFATDDAVAFDGADDVVVVPDDPALRPAEITVEAWVNPSSGIQSRDAVLVKSSNWYDGYGLFYDNGQIVFFINHYYNHRVNSPITIGSFSHVVGSYDGTAMKLYIDGVLVDTEPMSDPINHTTNSLMIGRGVSTSYTWTGLLDEVAVYDVALTLDDISDHHNLGPNGRGLMNIELLDGATPVHTIATDTANDGEFLWTIPWLDPPDSPPIAPGTNYRVRLTRTNDVTLTDQSNEPFEITEKKSIYYVNDNDLTGDGFTTAVGNDSNDGLDPSRPKASIAAVLAAYSLGAGDVIQVDVGTYSLSLNILLEPDDSGVEILGFTDPGDPSRVTVLDRGNQSSGSYVFEMAGADDVTLDSLVMRGGYCGINAGSGVDSDGLTVTGSTIHDHADAGIRLNTTNDNSRITLNTIYGNNYGICNGNWPGSADNTLIEGNTVHDNQHDGVYLYCDTNTTVRGNTIYNNRWGVYANQSSGTEIGDGNVVYANRSGGIKAYYGNVNVFGNEVFQNNDYGIHLDRGSNTAEGNEVHGNVTGIYAYRGGRVEDNRVYNNSDTGIYLYIYYEEPSALGNVVYSNSIGIQAWNQYSDSICRIENNLVYANTNHGIWLGHVSNLQVVNNTVYQEVGDAVHVQDSSSGVNLRNNILWVEAGYDIFVDPNSEVGFASDYNDLYATGTGQLGNWAGQGFSSIVDWRYEIGQDWHSQVADPELIDIDGADNILGFSYAIDSGYSPMIVDDGDAAFSADPAVDWSAGPAGHDGDSQQTSGTAGDRTATWTFSGLNPDAYYEVAVTWPADAGNTYRAPYQVRNGAGAVFASEERIDQRQAPTGISYGGTDWQRLGYFRPVDTSLVVEVSNYNAHGGNTVADAVLLRRRIEGEYGPDDVFDVASTSPTIDAGDPLDYYLSEPGPNGERVNQGHTANTADAPQSAAQLVQVLSPNGWEKYEEGQNVTVQWRSSGLTQERYLALVNAGGSHEDNWLDDAYSVTSDSTGSFTDPVDLSGVTNPAPEAVYQTYRYAAWGVGAVLSYGLPVPDGNYTIRLHFAEYDSWSSIGRRVFDVNLQGVTVQDDYDIFAAAGARDKATTLEFPVVAVGGTGIDLALVNETSIPAIISAIELRAANPAGVADPRVDLELSTDTGSTWSSLATDQAMDRFGRGSLVWAAGPQTSGNTALVKAIAQDGTQPQDRSDDPFLISNSGPDYYVSPTGDNLNSGKSLADPMASLAALIAAYDLDPGDTVHVGAGTYAVLHNIGLSSDDSGVLIQGSAIADSILDRGNQSSGSYVFEMAGADDVTLDSLVMRGGYCGINAGSGVDSDGLTVTGSTIHDHADAGIRLNTTNDNSRITLNTIYGNNYGICNGNWPGSADNTLIEGNTVHDNQHDGVYLYCDTNTTVRGNTIYNNRWGVYANQSSGTEIGDGNVVYANRSGGIKAYYGNVNVFGNEVFQNNDYGIHLDRGSNTAEGNEVHGNVTGIYAYRGGRVEDNRVYNNSDTGIYLYIYYEEPSALGNVVYSNSIGIQAWNQYSDSICRIENNLVYANTNHGIWLGHVSNLQVVNNTVYQEVGDAVHVQDSSSGVNLRNNILWVEAGYDIFVDPNSEVGFASDYNDLYATGTGQLGNWAGQGFSSIVDWRYEIGQDWHSQVADPELIDIDGADNILGFSYAIDSGYSPMIVDDGDAAFSADPAVDWSAGPAGHDGDSQQTSGTAGDRTATWTFSGLDPDAYYEVAITWPADASNTYQAPYQVRNGAGAVFASEERIDQRQAPTGISYGGTDWQRLGYFRPVDTSLVVEVSNYNAHGGNTVADAVLLRRIEGEYGPDDVFDVASTSPTIDAGDPLDYYLSEPGPNGERVNQGHTANTADAPQSAAQLVQVLSPNGWEKYEEGQNVTVQWRSSGLTQERYLALVNAGGSHEDNWLDDAYSVTSDSTGSFTDPVDLSGVTLPAPEAVYQTYRRAASGVGAVLSYALPVPDGNYTIRLHFAEYDNYSSIGSRVFDVNLQGATVQDDYDIFAAAGAHHKATTLEFPVVAVGGTGIDLALVNETNNAAIISAIELRAANPAGVADPRVDLELSTDTGSTWSSLATDQAMDRFGRGSLVWAAGPQTSGNTALVKTVAQDGTQPQDQSDDPFLISNSGPDYYVSPTGDNLNSGKSLADPMASLAALIAAYDLDPGDTVHVGAGTYAVLHNIGLSSDDSGVLIQGSAIADSILDRGNQSSGSYVFEMAGADDVTLDSLVMRGAYGGVYAGVGVDSDGLTVTGSTIHDHADAGIRLNTTNDNSRITLNTIYGNNYGICNGNWPGSAENTLIEGNTVHDNQHDGVYLYYDTNTTVRGNTIYNNRWGVYAYQSSGAEIGDGNVVYANRSGGIKAYYGNVNVFGNEVFQNNDYGIYLYSGTHTAQGNEVHGNVTGIYAYRGGRVEDNRVYNNSDTGIYLYIYYEEPSALGNVV